MSAKTAVPDAWEDDWEAQADKQVDEPHSENSLSSGKISKSERRARQAELNKKLWEEAEAPKNFHFLDARNDVPLKSDFKPAVKVLSRKPAAKVLVRNDPLSGVEHLTLEDDEEDSEEEARKNTPTLEERKLKAQREREEKQRKYEEVRERLFGSTGGTTSGTSSPGNVTPPRAAESKSRPKNKSTRDGGRPSSSSSANGKVQNRQLYDPSYTVKPESVYIQKRETPDQVQKEEQPLRAPRGPDGSGRGGFGFTPRGGKLA
ncbi:hypothetical protein MMC16_003207 [Acarospora aff. strigata]|nr:hypothetical protein [Acarospora aff. strigata]